MVVPSSPNSPSHAKRWKLSRSSFLMGCFGGVFTTLGCFVWSIRTLTNRQLDDDASMRLAMAHLEATTTATANNTTRTHAGAGTSKFEVGASLGEKNLRQPSLLKQASPTSSQATEKSMDGAMLDDVTKYVKKNGGYINDKVEIRTINGILTGVFAKQPLERGEVAWHIPEALWEHPESGRYCDAVELVRNMILAKNKRNRRQNPYQVYLASRSASKHHNLPFLWSENGQAMLKELFGVSLPFTSNYKGVVKDWWDHCDRRRQFSSWKEVDQSVIDAIATLEARHEDRKYSLMPFQDVANHVRSGGNPDPYNVEPRYEDSQRSKYGVGFQVATKRRIEAGEQLGFSYSDCEHCGNSQHDPFRYPTHYMFMEYGFVESPPQYWKLHREHRNEGKIKFKLYADPNDNSARVKFSKTPGSNDMKFLSRELERLHEFEQHYKQDESEGASMHFGKKKSVDFRNLPAHEHKLLWEYHKAFTEALTLAISQAPK